MKPAQSVFQKVMGEAEVFLSAHGFKRSGNYFRKRLPEAELRYSIYFQNSQASMPDSAKFTFEVFAEWKRRPAWYGDDVPQETWYVGAGKRIGLLMPRKKDTWWRINEGENLPAFATDICGAIASYALPFLEQFANEKQLEAYGRRVTSKSWNYCDALDQLSYDLIDKKSELEIRKSIRRVWFAGRIHFASKSVIVADIERLKRTYGGNIS